MTVRIGMACIPLLLLLPAMRLEGAGEQDHRVRVAHPGVTGSEAVAGTLVQTRGVDGRPDEFHMVVDSVSCNDEECEIVPVRLYWDELGFYKRFELAPGVGLEKAEGKPFSKEDHDKLHRVLSDRESAMWNVRIDELVKPSGNGVDVVSGPTVVLDKRRYVEGAVWTCYTLWHWANGGIGPVIREITAGDCSLEDLRGHLEKGSQEHKLFALRELTKREAYDPATLEAAVSLSSGDHHDLQKLLVDYVEKAPSGSYYSSLAKLLGTGNRRLRLMGLRSLLETAYEAPEGFHAGLGKQLGASGSYQEIDLFLKIVDGKRAMTPEVVTQVLALLKHDNFLIARRACWALADLTLTPSECDQLETFMEKNAGRL